jgi:hypothetical protein
MILLDFLALVLYLPWTPTLLKQLALVHSSFWLPRPTVRTLFLTGPLIAGFYLDYLNLELVAARFLPLSAHTLRTSVLAGANLLAAALIVGGFWRASRAEKAGNVALLSFCLLPILALFLVSRVTTPIFLDRLFIASSAVFPIVFACPLAAHAGRRNTSAIFFSCLGILPAAATTLSALGFLRYQQKENYRGAIGFLLGIPESNRPIVFLCGSDKDLFDYYSRRLPRRAS